MSTNIPQWFIDELNNEVNAINRYIIIGVEYDNLWKPIELFVGENEHGILLTTSDFNEAAAFKDLESAQYVIEYLDENFNDYSWHVLVSKNKK